jgi:hypothetical protein
MCDNFKEVESKKIWDETLLTIKEPPLEKQIWNIPKKSKLGVVMIECRCHEDLKAVLWNMAHVYGGTDTSLYIFHGTKNEEYIKNITGSWKNIIYINMGVENLTWQEYSYKLTTWQFWDFIKTEFCLIFQTDTLIFKQIPEAFFKYDFIGAPTGIQKLLNGGFSLRKTAVIKETCKNFGPEQPKGYNGAEDSFFAYYLHDSKHAKSTFPDFLTASSFAVERFYMKNTIGTHKPWVHNCSHTMACLLGNVPGSE